MTVKFREDILVELVDHMGSDERVVQAARGSTGKDLEAATMQKQKGLINYLLNADVKHSSPFEHCVVTFRIEAPMFVRDQWVRHRTQSFSIKSLRFAEASPEFYVANRDRPLVNAGSGAHPALVRADDPEMLYDIYQRASQSAYKTAWHAYKALLRVGVAEEVARTVLPSGLYTSFYVTANLWNWLQFLHKRIESKGNKPQWEIEQAALQIEKELENLFPISIDAWRSSVLVWRTDDKWPSALSKNTEEQKG